MRPNLVQIQDRSCAPNQESLRTEQQIIQRYKQESLKSSTLNRGTNRNYYGVANYTDIQTGTIME